MASEAAKRASAALLERRKAGGWRKVTVWLSPDVLEKVDLVVKKSDWTLSAAIVRLVDLGAEAFDATPKYVVKPGAAARQPKPAIATEASPSLGVGDVLTFDDQPPQRVAAVHVAPYFQRKAFNPQKKPTKGKK